MKSYTIEIIRVYEQEATCRVYPLWISKFLLLRYFVIRYLWWMFPRKRVYRYRIEWRGPSILGGVTILGIPFIVTTKNHMVDVRSRNREKLFLKEGDVLKVFSRE